MLRAARLIRPAGRGAALRLEKNLPVASGIGGGSADAAAALRLLARLWDVPLPEPAALLHLGADLPVCLAARACRMAGIGEELAGVDLPPFWIVLANPRVPLATGTVFGRLADPANPPLPDLPAFSAADALFAFLVGQRNDLEAAAVEGVPAIADVLAALAAQSACRLARMSGSGATCFGLFATAPTALAAVEALRRARPEWWIAAGPVAPDEPVRTDSRRP